MSDTPLVSVVIPTFQRRASVERLLQSLAQQSLPARQCEVVLCIDGCVDGTREMADAFNAPFTLRVHWQPNRGRGAACNAGIRMAQGELVLLLDDDMQATPHLLQCHCEAHQADQQLGLVGAAPIQIAPDALAAARYAGEKFNRHLQRLAQPGHVFAARDFYSGNFSIRRDRLCAAGLFDEGFIRYGNEDVELSLRLTRAGVRLAFGADALAWQHYAKDVRGLTQDHVEKGMTTVQMVRKHPDIFSSTKLAGHDKTSIPWRAARRSMLSTTQRWPRFHVRLITLMAALERRRVPGLHHTYGWLMDYCFWAGAEAAMRQDRLDLAAMQRQGVA